MTTDVLTPVDHDWDVARKAWNLSVDQRPAEVAFPRSAAEVADVVASARGRGLRVAVQGTGHGACALGPLDDTVLLKTERMRGTWIKPGRRVARVQAGAQWQDVVPRAAEHGLAALAGSAADVGVVGYTLGGGLGFLARRFGLACNSVTAVELVTAEGEHVRADAEHERELFWALRGGGGSFGAVTALEFALQPVASLYGGVLFWPWDRAAEVLTAWHDWTSTVADEMTSIGRILQIPPLPAIPEHLRGRQFVVVEAAYLGPEDEGAELLAPLRALKPTMDSFATISPTHLSALHNDPPEPVPGTGDGMLLGGLPRAAIESFVALAGPGSGSPFVGAEMRHLGGALARAPEDAGALATLEAPFATYCVGMTPTPEAKQAVTDHLDQMAEGLAPWDAGRELMNFKDRPSTPRALWGSAASRLLRQVKDQVDPNGVFVANHPV